VADAGGGEDPHRGLQCPQLEAKDEVVADAEAVTEGRNPLAPSEDGVATCTEDDVHGPDQLWPALLHQHDLANGEAGDGDRPLDYIGQPEGGQALVLDDNEELQEVGPVGVLDTGVSRSTCFWAPSTVQLWPMGKSTTKAQRRRRL
jgi:hypothetical protein